MRHLLITGLAALLLIGIPLPAVHAQPPAYRLGVDPLVAQTEPAPSSEPAPAPVRSNFFSRFFGAYLDEFKDSPSDESEPPRRALPAPLDSPPFPSSEWQGFPLVGVPYGTKEYPLTKALYGAGTVGEFLKDQRIKVMAGSTRRATGPRRSIRTFRPPTGSSRTSRC